MSNGFISIPVNQVEKTFVNIEALEWAIENAPHYHQQPLIDVKNIFINLQKKYVHLTKDQADRYLG